MATENHGKQIKNDDQYEALRERGMSKSKAARIANTASAGKKGGKQPPYEEWTRDELYLQARRVGIQGRSRMTKSELKAALRRR
ncbi:MAG: Rho termination factor [Alcanivorax sp.]|nr:Rho termination factor [Alcanivorax sp.]MAY09202.1 Rho termination factor [Alcanivorax sp.]MBI53548.1 Rho termination factor [Alcanivorax sp.]MBU59267.1 Rho termination factor [Alcanivorax sp.]HCE38673.1 Rho termination factor [Alcanivorax sp.]|tara:strand:- start:716 stop:967 length:252 start_codon:yes stop_codon:yes gene_type:complete